MRIIGFDQLHWSGATLCLGRRKLATVVPDGTWPGMYRVRTPEGRATDMANLARAKDAAVSVGLGTLNSIAKKQARRGRPSRFSERPVPDHTPEAERIQDTDLHRHRDDADRVPA